MILEYLAIAFISFFIGAKIQSKQDDPTKPLGERAALIRECSLACGKDNLQSVNEYHGSCQCYQPISRK